MNRLLISLHNGIGDIISILPFIDKLQSNYKITFETVKRNFEILDYFFHDYSIEQIEFTENSFYNFSSPSFDYVLNLNSLYHLNDIATFHNDEHLKKVPIQMFILGEMMRIGLYSRENIPTDFSPSTCVHNRVNKNDNILIFTRSSAENRMLGNNITFKLKTYYDKYVNVKINPRYENVYTLIKEIHASKHVFSVDSGPVHISESTQTPWTCFLTNNSYNRLFKYYKYGDYIHSSVSCSPCNHHGGHGCNRNVDGGFDCVDGFDSNLLISKINKCF